MINGRFLSQNDLYDTSSNYIVIGKDLEKFITIIDNKKIIRINNINYEVIGIMGYTDKISILDTKFYININCYLNNITVDKNMKFILTKYDNSYTDLSNELNTSFNDLEINDIETNQDIFTTTIKNTESLLILSAIVVLLFLLNIINIASYYIKDKLKEIGIRKNYGANSFNIFRNILNDYFVIISISSTISALFYSLIIKLKIVPAILGSTIYLLPVLTTYILTLLIGIIISLVTLIRVNKKSINTLIKGV
ncbi:MAG: ABC transporter permease [Clostridium sp.]|nr:ABC transporter permease [Clostridium sp.]